MPAPRRAHPPHSPQTTFSLSSVLLCSTLLHNCSTTQSVCCEFRKHYYGMQVSSSAIIFFPNIFVTLLICLAFHNILIGNLQCFPSSCRLALMSTYLTFLLGPCVIYHLLCNTLSPNPHTYTFSTLKNKHFSSRTVFYGSGVQEQSSQLILMIKLS